MIGRRFIGPALFAIADQVLVNGANFAASAFLIRYAPKEMFGSYGVAYSTLLLVTSSIDVLFALQMTFLAPHYEGKSRDVFCSRLQAAQISVSLGLAACVCIATLTLFFCNVLNEAEAALGLVLGAGSWLLSCQEFRRSVLYLFGRPELALIMTLVQISVWAASVFAAIQLGVTRLDLAVLGGLCVSGGVAALIGSRLLPLPDPGDRNSIWTAAGTAWKQGSWSLLGSIVSWIQNQSYAWIIAAFVGAAATADANFAKLFFSPLTLLLAAGSRIFRPALATVYAAGKAEDAVRQGRRLLLLVMIGIGIYLPCIIVVFHWVTALPSASNYAGVGPLLIAWAIVALIQATRWNSTLLLGVLQKNRAMTSMQIITALISAASSLALIQFFGVMGPIVAIGFGELLLTFAMWRHLNLSVGKSRS